MAFLHFLYSKYNALIVDKCTSRVCLGPFILKAITKIQMYYFLQYLNEKGNASGSERRLKWREMSCGDEWKLSVYRKKEK